MFTFSVYHILTPHTTHTPHTHTNPHNTQHTHTHTHSTVLFHPHLPVLLSGAEDGTINIWHATTYRLENTLNYGMERAWSIACLPNTNKVCVGYDEGTIMVKLGQEVRLCVCVCVCVCVWCIW
jgi:WD40 repeat protein